MSYIYNIYSLKLIINIYFDEVCNIWQITGTNLKQCWLEIEEDGTLQNNNKFNEST